MLGVRARRPGPDKLRFRRAENEEGWRGKGCRGRHGVFKSSRGEVPGCCTHYSAYLVYVGLCNRYEPPDVLIKYNQPSKDKLFNVLVGVETE